MERFSIPKMSCGGCVKTITGALRALDESAVVTADLVRREVSIRSSTGPDALLAALAQAGYPATKLGA